MNDLPERSSPNADAPNQTYKPFSSRSVIALSLSMVGLLAIAFPVLVVVCLIAAAIAVSALLQIRRREMGGRWVAQIALALAAFSIATSLTYAYGRMWYLQQIAYRHSQKVVNLIMEGRYAETWAYVSDPRFRPPKGTNFDEYYRGTDPVHQPVSPAQMLNTFKGVPPISQIVRDNEQGTMEFVGFGPPGRPTAEWEAFPCDYRYTPASEDIQGNVFRVVLLRREFDPPIGVQWRIRHCEVLEGPRPQGGLQMIGGGPGAAEEDPDDNEDE